jgi:hypothetical protein
MTEEQSKVRIGRVYKIIHQTDSNWCYVGSTFNKLHKRWSNHKYQFKRWLDDPEKYSKITWFVHAQEHDNNLSEYRCVLLQEYQVETKHQLLRYEGEWITKLKDSCCNRIVAGRTIREYLEAYKEYFRQKSKKYRETHKQDIKETKKKWVKNNKERVQNNQKEYKKVIQERVRQIKLREEAKRVKVEEPLKPTEIKDTYWKEWKEANPEKAQKIQATYREKHKEQINEKFQCECGGQYSRKHKKTHEYTKKHQEYLDSQHTRNE